MSDKRKPTTPEVIAAIAELSKFCVEHNDPEKYIFFMGYQGHVDWFEVSVGYNHYSMKIYDTKIYTNEYDHAPEEDAHPQQSTLDSIAAIQKDLQKIVAGKFGYEIKLTLGK